MIKVIDFVTRRFVSAAELQAADSRECADMAPVARGVPRTHTEWTALVKVASGELDIARDQFERLFALGLVERRRGHPTLTSHGRYTLGLPE